MNWLRRAIGEIHRRSLWQVLGIYVAGSWAALQAVDVLAESAGLPDWFPPFALGLLIIGLPVVLATAFVQEGIGADTPPASGAALADRNRGTESEATITPDAAIGDRPTGPAARRLFTWRNALSGGVAAFALWGVLATGWLLLGGPATSKKMDGPDNDASRERASVAVLPFAMRSAVAEDSFFVQGVHDDILTQLARLEDLKVISRTSVNQYADTDKPVRQIADELGVTNVLEGGVQRAGARIRVTAQLIDARTDDHLWAANYDEALTTENVFAIQTQIARAIAGALESRLTQAEEARIAVPPTDDLEAYDLYNRARYHAAAGTVEARRQALDLFRRAAAIDPEFAAAHAGFADAFLELARLGEIPIADSLRAEVRAAVTRALALDPGLPEAHVAHAGMLLLFDLDTAGAERAYRRALELGPGLAHAHHRLGGLYLNSGRLDDAGREYRRAVDLDPLDFAPRANLAFVELARRDYQASEAQASRVIELDPGHFVGYYMLCAALTFQDRHEEAIAAAREAVRLDPGSSATLAILGFAHARAGDRDSALAITTEVEERDGSFKEIALVHAALGDLDRAFEYLERTLELNPGELAALGIDPSADPLREDSRYGDLLRRAGLEE